MKRKRLRLKSRFRKPLLEPGETAVVIAVVYSVTNELNILKMTKVDGVRTAIKTVAIVNVTDVVGTR